MTTTSNVRGMTCAVCGEYCRGRQWHNRDTGFGLCAKSAEWLRKRGTPETEMIDLYGHEGIHYNVPEA